jgi:hypothetical protein
MINGGPRTVVAPDLLPLDSNLSTAAVTERTEGWQWGRLPLARLSRYSDGNGRHAQQPTSYSSSPLRPGNCLIAVHS